MKESWGCLLSMSTLGRPPCAHSFGGLSLPQPAMGPSWLLADDKIHFALVLITWNPPPHELLFFFSHSPTNLIPFIFILVIIIIYISKTLLCRPRKRRTRLPMTIWV
jgi:hypothetical protein